jgi:hypothetical protein
MSEMVEIFFNRNEEFENEYICFTPIKKLLYRWSIDCKKDVLKQDYYNEPNKGHIIGLVIYKNNGEWFWAED